MHSINTIAVARHILIIKLKDKKANTYQSSLSKNADPQSVKSLLNFIRQLMMDDIRSVLLLRDA